MCMYMMMYLKRMAMLRRRVWCFFWGVYRGCGDHAQSRGPFCGWWGGRRATPQLESTRKKDDRLRSRVRCEWCAHVAFFFWKKQKIFCIRWRKESSILFILIR
jgi:hypothetical protein